MPTVTYTPIGNNTISGSSTTAVTFSSISSAYTDLVLIVGGKASTGTSLIVRYNGDTGSNYTRVYGYGNGASHSQGHSGTDSGVFATLGAVIGQTIYHINSYQASYYKNTLFRNDHTDNATVITSCSWKNTAAITSIEVSVGSYVFSAGTVISLYGIA